MDSSSPNTQPFEESGDERRDRLCDQFEDAWRAGQRPRIEDYVCDQVEPDRSKLFVDLLDLELELRREGGEKPTIEEYEVIFPQYAALIRALFLDAGCLPPEWIDRFKVIRSLGGGGFGHVYLCHDDKLQRNVAIKVPRQDRLSSTEAKQLFLREARSVAGLHHEAIVTLHEFGETEGQCYLVYEYIAGCNLADRLKQTAIPQYEAAKIIARIAEALYYAHGEDRYHRDIKPANILLDQRKRPYLTDFGLAVRVQDLAGEQGRRIGTAHYMAPEQVRGEGDQIDGRADTYSLGAVLYELLTGQRPFHGRTRKEVCEQILSSREPRPPREINHVIHPCLQDICLKAMNKVVSARYFTAGDMAEELLKAASLLAQSQVAVESKPIAATALTAQLSSTPPLAQPPGRPRPLRWIAAGFLVALLIAGLLFWRLRSRPTDTIDAVAILPLASETADAEVEYLGQGITESLIRSLSRVHALKVRPFTSVASYKQRPGDVRAIGRALGVDALVVGEISRRGRNLTVNVELIDARDNSLIWADRYDTPFGDILTVQVKIAKEIIEKLKLHLTGEEQNQLAKRYTENTEAYQLYLLGRYHWNLRSPEAVKRAIDYFEQAISKDPNFALAYAGLADCYDVLVVYGLQPPSMFYPKAKGYALTALRLDESLAEAHTSLASVLTYFDWDWPEAEKHYLRALELNPHYVTARHRYSRYLSWLGRHEEAVDEARRARGLDPFSLQINTALAFALYHARRYGEAEVQARHVLRMDPTYPLANAVIGWCNEATDKYREAAEVFQTLIKSDRLFLAALAEVYARWGKVKEARQALAEMEEIRKTRYFPLSQIALVYAVLGDKDRAFTLLDRACDDRDNALTLLKIQSSWDGVRSDPRFAQLLVRLHFEPPAPSASRASNSPD
jgi:serine/threonine-protein kinase